MSREVELVKPAEIEARSFAIITAELAAMGCVLEGDNADVIKRVIHTTADFDYRHTLYFFRAGCAACVTGHSARRPYRDRYQYGKSRHQWANFGPLWRRSALLYGR